MSSPNTLTVTDEGTRPSSGIVDTNPSRNAAETPVSLSHEGESPSPSQAVTNATPETTCTTTSSSSVTSGVVSDIESSTSLTGTEIMAMRRQRTVNRIVQHFCQYLDWISKGNAVRASTEPFHQTSSRSLPRPSLPESTRCDNIPAPNTGLPGQESFENAESLYQSLKQLTWFDDIRHDPFMEPTALGNARDPLDSGIDMTFCGSPTFVELSKEGRSDEYQDCLPDPWTALELPIPATSKDGEDLRLSKNLPSGFFTNQISVPWYPSVLELDDGPEPSTKMNGILHDSTPTPNMHLAVNTMRSEIGRPVNDTNQSNGIRKHAAEDDGDHDGRRKRQKVDDGRKFACPFFKRNARKYSKWTSCPGPGWDEIHRVKSHLYRRHELIQCPRCWSTHKNNKSLVAHLQTDPSCEKQPNLSIVDGVTPEQKEKLLSRKKTHGDMTDEEKWRHMYMILFPDDDKDSIPSPCILKWKDGTKTFR
ncbi:hypothetical protein GE21DRAFT_6784 [Neurospora crassa]|uniref:C2H2-type domain-containing protein n=1 Tax=Neurospora crassa (strain ATCC 24698 / 74-OR23-1A / CBS 708.71 / DSM 1257 / FGSC 987) TaxID=367110 RepID=Q7S004_NEUCR|nr:hypothetical protein NCU10070 [Neurospora crassa OR74A]EAA28616.2 hypothetical protein NCU10070 [Neurospora crassa OR74A]KHE79061.1 hypothetical protein GE21DRAFT_6784 [Neurospora crassa]|eukprot:XP_957852.2 hypothetical protein NCU10070 [Neurospora crassa OR74A]